MRLPSWWPWDRTDVALALAGAAIVFLAATLLSGCATGPVQASLTPWTHSPDHSADAIPGVQVDFKIKTGPGA